jgi:hypothetical protein
MAMRQGAWFALLGALMTMAAACGDAGRETPGGGGGSGAGNSSTGAMGTGAGTGTGTGTGSAVGGAGAVPMFETDIVPLFEASCGTAEVGCHMRDAYAASSEFSCRGWLSLENAAIGSEIYAGDDAGQSTGCPDIPLYERLMMDAWQCGAPGTPGESEVAYVVPCEPASSYILHKMIGTPMCEDPGGVGFEAMPPDEPTDQAAIALVTAWIEAGAPRVDGTGVDCGGGEGGAPPTGSPPSPFISHPSDGETRPAAVPVPLIGEAADPEDGQLGGGALVWSSSIDGQLGTGGQFDVTLSVGVHTLTLAATDSDGNSASDSIQLIMEP